MSFFNWLMTLILRSPLHALVSGGTILITFAGRKSGRTYTIPVNYVRNGSELLVVSYRSRIWWRNLRGGAPVVVRLQGKDIAATAEAIENEAAVAAALAEMVVAMPRLARRLGLTGGRDGRPEQSDLVPAARNRVVTRIRPKDDS